MTTGEVVVKDTNAALARFLGAATALEPIDPQQAALDMVRRILAGDTVDEVLEGQAAIHAADVLGVTLVVTGVRWNESDLGGGPGFYALMDCVDGDGNSFTITCGAITVMAQLFRLHELGAFPTRLVIEEAEKATRSGYKPMSLRKGEEPF